MKAARLAFTDAAMADVLEQFDWYTEKAGRIMAERWEASIAATLLKIARRPASGSPCKFKAEELRGTRRVPVSRFPRHLVFYQAQEDEILILRVVHGARDLESLFSEGEHSAT
ncbi:MAG TPA: type II toxin-antitoxin system RelE/ParE family toxin [Terriglobales bacterium]|nr:type II toxin-antitoxin system RelE/ParE family toxin [Terriglobales bacterium]